MVNFQPETVADDIVTAVYGNLKLARLVNLKTKAGTGNLKSVIEFEIEQYFEDTDVNVQTAADREAGNRNLVKTELKYETLTIPTKDRIYLYVPLRNEWRTFVKGTEYASTLRKMARVVAQRYENEIADLLEGLPASTVVADFSNPDSFADVFARHTTYMVENHLDVNEASTVIGTNVYENLIKNKIVSRGETGNSTALLQAAIGPIFGLQAYVDTTIDPNTIVSFHQDVIGGASIRPAGSSNNVSGSADTGGIALGFQFTTSDETADDQLLVHGYFGADYLAPERGIRTVFTNTPVEGDTGL